MKTMKRFAAVLLVTMLTAGVAQAGTLSLTGTVEAGVTVPVYAPIGGTVEIVSIEQGMRVSAGDTLFSYRNGGDHLRAYGRDGLRRLPF